MYLREFLTCCENSAKLKITSNVDNQKKLKKGGKCCLNQFTRSMAWYRLSLAWPSAWNSGQLCCKRRLPPSASQLQKQRNPAQVRIGCTCPTWPRIPLQRLCLLVKKEFISVCTELSSLQRMVNFRYYYWFSGYAKTTVSSRFYGLHAFRYSFNIFSDSSSHLTRTRQWHR